MPQYRFTTIRDLNTFSTILQKNWVVEVECIAQNNPLLLLEDRMKIEKYRSEQATSEKEYKQGKYIGLRYALDIIKKHISPSSKNTKEI